jgi:hypothetical protein
MTLNFPKIDVYCFPTGLPAVAGSGRIKGFPSVGGDTMGLPKKRKKQQRRETFPAKAKRFVPLFSLAIRILELTLRILRIIK